jgi:LmbE family N-acetylglucosaminyl deacetylase
MDEKSTSFTLYYHLQAMVFVLLLLTTIFIFWLYCFNKANDLAVPTKKVKDFGGVKRMLVIFPHPDDEANSLAGTIWSLVKNNIEVNWAILSRGEKGNDDAHYDEKLKGIRSKEAKHVAKILNIKDLSFRDYPDNDMARFKGKLIEDIKDIISSQKPDLIVTYDLSGGYGHPDHIVVSEVVTDLIKNDFPGIRLWYVSTPKKLFNELSLPEYMAKDKDFKLKRKNPNFKVWVGTAGIIKKTKAVYAYKSQLYSFVKSVPIKKIPLWFYISLGPYEYFYEVK